MLSKEFLVIEEESQFDQLQSISQLSQLSQALKGSDLADRTPRTLIYGYTCSMEDFHVYLDSNGCIYRVVGSIAKCEDTLRCNEEYVPDKRAYPETVDFEFAKLLEKGIYLPYTTPNWDRPVQQFYGKVV